MKNWTEAHIGQLKDKGGIKKAVKPVQREDDLQKSCVRFFAFKYALLWQQKKLHAIPNGGSRNVIEAAKMKATGTMPGVSDMMLTIPRKGYAGMFIEFKTAKGKLSEHQKAFIESHKEEYYICIIRSIEEFEKEVHNYLQQ
jgi:hypothetical protein